MSHFCWMSLWRCPVRKSCSICRFCASFLQMVSVLSPKELWS